MRLRYRTAFGFLLLVASVCAGIGAAELLEGRVPLRPPAIGCLVAGVTLLGVDLAVRRFGPERRFWSRYLGTGSSLKLYGALPLWVLGFTLLVAALSFPTP